MQLGRAFVAGCLVALLPGQGVGLAQKSSERLEEQKVAMSGFYWRFVLPLDACTIAGPPLLEKARALVNAVREKYSRTFDLVERHPVYHATVYAARATDDRYKAPGGQGAALQDCSLGIDLLENPNAQSQYDSYMQYLLELLSTPT